MTDHQDVQLGDGQDDYGKALSHLARAGSNAARHASGQAVEAGANAAAVSVMAGESGKAVAGIAAGTAVMGPWGAVLSAALSLRHTLYKVLICAGLFLLLWIIMIVSLPSIMTEGIKKGWNQMQQTPDFTGVYTYLADEIAAVVEEGYEDALEQVEAIIADGGYDRDLSMDALIDYAYGSAGYDTGYVLAAYSASLKQQNTDKDDMLTKLDAVTEDMFPVTMVEKQNVEQLPIVYQTYKQVEVTVVTRIVHSVVINGVPQTNYGTATWTYYEPSGNASSDTQITVPKYEQVTVRVPVYTGDRITGTQFETYYKQSGEEILTPELIFTDYAECTIHPFDQAVITDAFGIDLAAPYDQFQLTYAEVIQKMAEALKMTMYGTVTNGQMVPLTDTEMQAFVTLQGTGETRKQILTTALSLVGRVPYFWGGKSEAGWNAEWNTPKLVTASDSSSSGTIRPYGMDCSGFTDWVYKTALGASIGIGSSDQWDNSTAITEAELKPGDLGFLAAPSDVDTNHVLIYAGRDENGKQMWVHCESGNGVVLNSPDYVTRYRRPFIVDLE